MGFYARLTIASATARFIRPVSRFLAKISSVQPIPKISNRQNKQAIYNNLLYHVNSKIETQLRPKNKPRRSCK